jgi:sugar (pentulose or hexulose) kinase
MSATTVDLGFDLGTTVTKVTALAGDGSRRADLSVATEWRSLGHGRSERDPADVVAAVEHLLEGVAAALEPGTTVRAIGFTSMAEAGVLVDAEGIDHSPVIAWHDPRGARQAEHLSPELAEAFPAHTGLAVSHVASIFKLAWMREHGLDLRGLQWLSVPEYVILRLGGRRVAELSLLGRTGLLDVHTNQPWAPALDHLGLDSSFLPEIVGAGTPAGTVRADHPVAAVRGAVLTVAGHDHAVAAAATGCGASGSALDSFGTAEAYVAAAAHVPDPDTVRELCLHGVSVYPHVVRGVTGFLAATRTGTGAQEGSTGPRHRAGTGPQRAGPRCAHHPRRQRDRRPDHRVRHVGLGGLHRTLLRRAHPGTRLACRTGRRHGIRRSPAQETA